MKMAIAVETKKHPREKNNYRVWFLELDKRGQVISLGVKSREELLQDLMNDYRVYGGSKWKAFLKDHDESTPIELHDFIAQSMHNNTHFGNLPTLNEFQNTLDALGANLEIKSHAC